MENKKRDYTKFFTYPETAELMATILSPKEKDVVLEPSAGNGRLCRAVKDFCDKAIVVAVELYEEWRDDLKECADVVIIRDFITLNQFQSLHHALLILLLAMI